MIELQNFKDDYIDSPVLDGELYILSPKNPDKHPITIGFFSQNGNGKIRINVQYAICSESDPFNEETGKNIVIGKLMLDQRWRFSVDIHLGSSEEELAITHSFINRIVKQVEGYCEMRDARDKAINSIEQVIRNMFNNDSKGLLL